MERWFVVHSWLNSEAIENSEHGDDEPKYVVCQDVAALYGHIEDIVDERDFEVRQVTPAYLALLAFMEDDD